MEKLQGTSITDLDFDEDNIKDAIAEVSSRSAAEPDRYPTILLRNCYHTLAQPLYWKSMNQGTIEHIQGDSRGLPKQYREVLLTSHLTKVFEKVIRKYTVSHLEENKLLNKNQHAWFPRQQIMPDPITLDSFRQNHETSRRKKEC